MGNRPYRGGLHKIRGLAPLRQLCQETLKFSHPPCPPPLTHYKTNTSPPFLASPQFPVKISQLPIIAISEKFHPSPLHKGGGGEEGLELCIVFASVQSEFHYF